MAATRRQLFTDFHRDIGSSVAESERLLLEMTRTADYREGVAALVEKREPRF